MSANLYAWTDDSKLHPLMDDFEEAYDHAIQRGAAPDARLIAFVRAVLEIYPEPRLPTDPEDDFVWAVGPVENEITGTFLNVAIMWSRIDEVTPVFLSIAREHALHAYDPQSEVHYPPR